MSSPPPRRPSDKPWFQDGKTGCEKQSGYFVKIRKLQEQLINREQHNLINAMERLKQVQYPRKKPIVRNFDVPVQTKGMSFPARPMNARRMRRLPVRPEQELAPLRGKHITTDSDMAKPRGESKISSFTAEELRRIYQMMPMLSDNEIAKIVCNASSTFSHEPSKYLLQPYLPSIPNVTRKADTRLDNRLRLLSLATEPAYIDHKHSMTTRIQTGHSRSQRRSVHNADAMSDDEHFHGGEAEKKGKRKQKNILTFDVAPDDPTLFTHCVDGDKSQMESDLQTPLPPPNSRPSSTKPTKKCDSSSKNMTARPGSSSKMMPIENDDISENKHDSKSLVSEMENRTMVEQQQIINKTSRATTADTDNSEWKSESSVTISEPIVTIVRKPSTIEEKQE